MSDFAWVIEVGSGDDLKYYAPTAPGGWVRDHLKACRFARKEDAEAIQFRHVMHGPLPVYDTRVCEHGWIDQDDSGKRFGERVRTILMGAAEQINAAR